MNKLSINKIMAIYSPPTQDVPTFNPVYWDKTEGSSTYLTTELAASTYAKLAGNQTIIGFETFSGGIKTETLQSIVLGNDINVSENINLASGKALEINGTSVLSSTTLGSSVVNSSLTSLGTLSAGVNLASGQTYKINNTEVLSSTTLGASVTSSSLQSLGTSTNTTVYFLQGVTTLNTTGTRVSVQLSTASSIIFEEYTFTLASGTTAFTLPFRFNTAFVKFCVRTSNRSYLLVCDAYTNGTTVAPSIIVSARITWSAPTAQISVINGVNTPAMTLSFASALASATTFSVFSYYFTE